MPAESGYEIGIVLVNRHEPEGEATGRLLEIAEEKGYSPRVVEAQRGEHDTALSFRVPEDVAEAFNAERGDLWTASEVVADEDRTPPAGVDEDAFAADAARRAEDARTTKAATADETVDDDNDPNTPPVRKTRPGKQRQE